jgi:heptose I phosphotransferase
MDIVGFSQQGFNPASLQSFLITRELDNTISLEDYCANWPEHPPVYREKKLLIQTVAEIVKKMHDNGINHRDLYICHFLMKKTDNVPEDCKLFLIDLHRTQIRKNVPERWLVKDLGGLFFSAMDIGLTKRDLLRFIKIYRGNSLRKIFKREAGFWQKIEHKANVLYGRPESKKKR